MQDREADIHNFSTSPSQHRLPTVSAIEALETLSAKCKGISSSLPALDVILANGSNGFSITSPGIQRGHVTEVYGPPGVGKTTFGLQAAASAIRSGHEDSDVLWVDTGSPFIEERLDDLMRSYAIPAHPDLPSSPKPLDTQVLLEDKFTYLSAYTLARLLTLFLHPPHSFPSSKTCLIVIDDLSNLLLGSFSRNPRNIKASAPAAVREKFERQAVSKRFQIIENLGAAMSKMAALKNVAILVLTNTTTSLKNHNKAILKAALASQAWESAVHTRIMLFRDFANEGQGVDISGTQSLGMRYAEVQRLAWKDICMEPVPFVIRSNGLQQLGPTTSPSQAEVNTEPNDNAKASNTDKEDDPPLLPVELSQRSQSDPPAHSRKRKIIEIADSEDEGEGSGIDMPSDFDEPELPSMDFVPRVEIEEMILETHETALLRRDRYARIRGSEDEIPEPSSDLAEEVDAVASPNEGEP
ncbi:AAA domain-containing protein [Cladophialophora immunda]|nr:AAA domain-containing protein [Cladophialophora immunda]